MTYKVCVIGASGFAGAELLRICAAHPDFDVTAATGDSTAGQAVADLYPNLAASYGDMRLSRYHRQLATGSDLVFCALPHGASQAIVAELHGHVGCIVDLAADFRLDDASLYPEWYGADHTAPGLLNASVFGLPELFRPQLVGAKLVAAPGCYVTAAALALAPVVAAALVEPTGLVVNAASGVSGAGRPPKPHTTFCAVDGDFTAYGLLRHRHTPEIEMAIARHSQVRAAAAQPGAGTPTAGTGSASRAIHGTPTPAGTNHRGVEVLFTPHLAPMSRGILATCYARPSRRVCTDDVLACLVDAYHSEPFVTVSSRSPSTKATAGSNSVHVTARADERTGWVIVIAALDNLVKGASGQAVQCANLALGLDETAGLPMSGLYP